MKQTKRIFLIFLALAAIALITWAAATSLPENIWGAAEAVGTVLGVFLVLYELKETRELSEGSFLTGLSDSFNNNASIQKIYKKLEMGEPITDDDTVDIVSYLTYFETMSVLLKKGVINMDLVDDLFAYRFRLALNSKAIRRISLVRHDTAYVNIYELEKRWCHFKNIPSILEQHNPNYALIADGGNRKPDDVLIMPAEDADAEEIAALMQAVYDGLEDKTLYVCDGLEYVKTHLHGDGFGVKACTPDGKIVGSFICRFPKDSSDSLGLDVSLPAEELPKVVHMETAVVAPEYRGRGIQKKMLQYAEELVDTDRYTHLMATVSPHNPASCKTFEKCGYTVKLTKEKYGGLLRHIYLKTV